MNQCTYPRVLRMLVLTQATSLEGTWFMPCTLLYTGDIPRYALMQIQSNLV